MFSGGLVRKLIIFLYLVAMNAYASNWENLVFGNWEVTRIIPTKGIAALSQTEAEAFVHSKFFYSKSETTYNKISCNSPKFKVVKTSEEQFFDGFYNTFAELGISDDFTYTVNVNCSDNNSDWFIGSFLYTKDINHLVVFIEGVFFELERVQTSRN